jgi:hypothetical protein
MIVMITAITPSENASTRFFSIAPHLPEAARGVIAAQKAPHSGWNAALLVRLTSCRP